MSGDGDDGEYADLFQSSGEEYRSDEDVYADEEEDAELRVSSAIGSDAKQLKRKASSSSKRSKPRTEPDGQNDEPKGTSKPYRDNFSDDDEPDREALLQSYIDQKLNEPTCGGAARIVRILLILALVVGSAAAVVYLSNVGVTSYVEKATAGDAIAGPELPAETAADHSDHNQHSLVVPKLKDSVDPTQVPSRPKANLRKKKAAGRQPRGATKPAAAADAVTDTKAAAPKPSAKVKPADPVPAASNGKVSQSKTAQKSKETSKTGLRKLTYTVKATVRHNRSDFVEGLEFWNGNLFECTGRQKKTWVKSYSVDDPSHPILAYSAVDSQYFGEGCTIIGGKLYELTYKKKQGFIYKASTLERVGQFKFDTSTGEGWGVTHDDDHIIVSDGSNVLAFWDPSNPGTNVKTLKIEGTVGGRKLWGLNELEYVADCPAFPGRPVIFANIFPKTWVVALDAKTGELLATIDFSNIFKTTRGMDVFNGIAYRRSSRTFFVTGKNWPKMFEISINAA